MNVVTEHDRVVQLKEEVFDLYHKVGKTRVWRMNNDEVCDMCETYILQKIKEIWKHEKL